jgi:ABC-type branched-subunit amino acid transport system ATPase component
VNGTDSERIRVDQVSAGYGASDIIRSMTFEAAPGLVTAIAGPNGAGKSTLMKTIAGLLRPRSGRIFLGDRDISLLGSAQRAAAGLGYVPQEHNVFKNLTVAENLSIGFEFIRPARRSGEFRRGDFSAARDRVLTLFPDLGMRLRTAAGALSGGQRQMLAIGSAMMPGPAALLLDEPSAGLSPRYVSDMLAAVRRVNEAGVTVLMIEQNLAEAIRICDAVVLVVGGEVRGQWRADGFLDDPQVHALFFGGAREAGRSRVHAGGAGDAGVA